MGTGTIGVIGTGFFKKAGFNVELMYTNPSPAEVLGIKRVIGCVTGWGATLHGPREVEMTSLGEFAMETIENRAAPHLGMTQQILNCIVPWEISDNILGSLCAILVINSWITSNGQRNDIKTPVNNQRETMRHEIEAAEQTLCPANLDQIIFFLKENTLAAHGKRNFYRADGPFRTTMSFRFTPADSATTGHLALNRKKIRPSSWGRVS